MFSANELWKRVLLSVLNGNVQCKSKQIKFVLLDTKLQCQLINKYSVCTKYISFQRVFYMGKGASVNIASYDCSHLFYHGDEANIDAEFQ